MSHVGSRERGSGGFTLVELMIVVAVLAIVVAMAIPGFSNAKQSANEASAIASLKAFQQTQIQYRLRYGNYAGVADLVAVGMIDSNFADLEKAGYSFLDSLAPTTGHWAIESHPLVSGVTGNRFFFVDSSGVIRYQSGAPADSTSKAVD